ncbi:hypothetical protein RND81_01G093600 [Saponaria officinalis]|uniref:Uncharacterized protein n=1 Tax=Saponaria officinalis TaxID=3572 RepID=A0AAW1NEB0_SAPOF
MSMLYSPPPPPPPQLMASPPPYTTHGSIGAVIGVLAVVLVLCVGAVLVGRLCSGRGIRGRTHYDMESWVETKCSSCVDGRIVLSRPPPSPPPPPPPPTTTHGTTGGGGDGGHEGTQEQSPPSNAAS